MKMSLPNVIMLTVIVVLLSSCGRNNNSSTNEEPVQNDQIEITQPAIKDATLITPDEPFKNQPNEFCTVIRKLDISYYAPEKEVEDITAYPQKYCLLDVCLDKVDPNGLIINLGEDDEVVTTSFELIKVFESEAEAKSYVEKYHIVDAKWE